MKQSKDYRIGLGFKKLHSAALAKSLCYPRQAV